MGDVADRQPPGRRGRRIAVGVVAALAAVAASAAVAYRVLAPAEVITEATAVLPAPASAAPGVIGTLAAAPLIVDGRVRVYATTRQVRADGPVDARTQRSALWSYRRWPEQLVGVVAAGRTVVSRWSDGRLVAIDAHTGRVAWRADGPPPANGEYAGRRTGAAVVYAPDGLYTAGDVVVARGPLRVVAVDAGHGAPGPAWSAVSSEIRGYDAATGRELWRRSGVGPECGALDFTTAGGRYAVAHRCGGTGEVGPVSVELLDATTGEEVPGSPAGGSGDAAPVGCRVGRSECAGVRVGHTGWLLAGDRPARAAALDDAVALAVTAGGAPVAVVPGDGGQLRGVRADTGEPLWRWLPGDAGPAGRATVIATQPGRLHLLTAGFFLVTVDAGTGVEESRLLFTYGRERTGYAVGHAYASDGFVLLERLSPGVDASAEDDAYYFIGQPVLLAGA